jgi:hypothetical protein
MFVHDKMSDSIYAAVRGMAQNLSVMRKVNTERIRIDRGFPEMRLKAFSGSGKPY